MRLLITSIVGAALWAAPAALAQQTGDDDPVKREAPAELAFAKTLFGAAGPDMKQSACYVRHYDSAHLKAHPIQKVTDIRILLAARPLTPAESKGTADIPADGHQWHWRYGVHAVLRNGSTRNQSTSPPCQFLVDGKGVPMIRCNIACDAGDTIRLLNGGASILFGLAHGDLADKKYDPQMDNSLSVDDMTFLLERAPPSQCTGGK